MRRQTEAGLDQVRCSSRIFMLPNADDLPASATQPGVYSPVTSNVSIELLLPIRPVALGLSSVLGTAVPEASIDQHCDPRAGEYDIRPRSHVLNNDQMIDPEPTPSTMKLSTNLNLGHGVLPTIRLHGSRRRSGGWSRITAVEHVAHQHGTCERGCDGGRHRLAPAPTGTSR